MPGPYVVVNNDDDNGNGIPDIDDAGPITRENDLKPVNISFGNCVTADCDDGAEFWGLSSLSGTVRLFFDADKSLVLKGDQDFPAPS